MEGEMRLVRTSSAFRSYAKFKLLQLLILSMSVTFALIGGQHKALAQWIPSKPVEIVIMGTPGGGEKAVRFLDEIIKKHNLATISFTIVNKPSPSGAAGVAYLAATSDPNHTLLITSKTFYTGFLRDEGASLDLARFTPIAAMGADNFMIWTPSDRKDINTISDLVKAAQTKYREHGQEWTMGGTSQDSEDSLLTGFLRANYHVYLKYIPLGGGGEVARNLADKKVNSSINVPSEQSENLAAGKVKPIVTFAEKRLSNFPNVPTMAESGGKFSLEMQRTIAGSPNMSVEAKEFYSVLFQKIYNSPEWQAYCDKNSLLKKFMTGSELMEYWMRQLRLHRIMLSVMDLLNAPSSPAGGAPTAKQ
jgi:putative tricarboxylic transport membrane protein